MESRPDTEILTTINSPADLKKLPEDKLPLLASELRRAIISTVSQTGGHLATNLGSVELTIALHRAFDMLKDRVVWDVSNQTYSHKMLTGRREQMNSIRQYHGLSGFSKRDESPYDHFGAGHASTSISAALGFAAARDNAKENHHVIGIIGDGAMTGGLAYEGLNNAGSFKSNFIVILNDNSWSISKNVGAISKYLTNITTDEKFNKLREEIWEMTGKFKRRDKIRSAISRIEKSVQALLVPGMFFRQLGFRYFGPIDGHDMPLLINTFEKIKTLSGPILLHVATIKGKGFDPAEVNPTKFHGVGKFDKLTGQMEKKKPGRPAYMKVFGDSMVEIAEKDKSVIAISAAMAPGTGLSEFAEKFPDRFYDVGIAEGHAGTFAAGIAAGGKKAYLTLYSTFMQRAFDQIIHDIALQKLPVIMCMDRAGLVGNDGPTHHGVFDLSYVSSVPDITVAVPKDGNELRSMIHYTVDNKITGPIAIRYPRETVPTEMTKEVAPIDWLKWEFLTKETDVYLIACGTMVATALEASKRLAEKGTKTTVVNARFISPMDMEMLGKIKKKARAIITIEENVRRGGMGQAISDYLLSQRYPNLFKLISIPDRFITHGARELLIKEVGLDVDSVTATISSLLSSEEKSSGGIFSKLRLNRTAEKKTSEDNEDSEKDPNFITANKSR